MKDSPLTTPPTTLKEQKRALINAYSNANDRAGLREVLVTVIPLAGLWVIAAMSVDISWWLTAATTLAITVMMLRVFSLMHDCGHGSLFRTQSINRAVGFLFGVSCGMPQYVWSQHHHFHHQTNGNWDKYRGPLTTKSIAEFNKLSGFQQWVYRWARHFAFAPLAGFVYLLFNPRFNWIRGSIALGLHIVTRKIAEPRVPFRAHANTFKTRLWKSWKEYRHQTANNIALITTCVLMSWAMGPAAFFAVYLVSTSLAGGVGIALFTVQHNFENAYASNEEAWDIDVGAVAGTSFLILPRWLNWATANIGYHHVHHLSASIPCYSLVPCHEQYQHLFTDVRRITLWQIPKHLACILWDTEAQRIISIPAYRQATRTELAA